jgi:alpha-amylase/alpha-mannosidase (GH57 family)
VKWLNFLHFYQPANQQKDILEAVVKQSYFPIFKKINELSNVSITVNITGSLIDLFYRDGYTDLLDLIRTAVKDGKVELTGSCKYHAFLPLIDQKELKRQVEQNASTLREFLGFEYKFKGFFPPEMGYDPKIAPVIRELGFEWIILDEICGIHNESFPISDKIYIENDSGIKVVFRNRRISNLIMSAVARDNETLKAAFGDDSTLPYIVTGMDGETFGHHRIGFENVLFGILEDTSLGTTGVSDYLSSAEAKALKVEAIQTSAGTWASSLKDIKSGTQFLSWHDPNNPIHSVQWEFLNFTLNLVNNYSADVPNYLEVRNKMDMALASDHFWWASAKPWWSLEMIEDGAFRLLDTIKTMNGISSETEHKAYKFYMNIVSQAAAWQREGIVRQMAIQQNEFLRIPFKDRTLGKGGNEEGVYYAFLQMMRQQEEFAAKKGDYEKAILWRDAIYKIDHKYDIYDAINVIDLLRVEVGNKEVETFLDEFTKEYRLLRGGQPEQRGQ